MKLVICGSRNIQVDTATHNKICVALYSRDWRPTEIVSGCAKGGDRAGEKFAEDSKLPISRFPADWDRHGKQAGFLRNAAMVAYADAVLALWDGKSKGTKHTIDLAKKAGKPCHVVLFDLDEMRIKFT